MALATKPFRVEDYLKTPEDWAAFEQALREEQMGAWPDNPTFPVGYDERDSKGV